MSIGAKPWEGGGAATVPDASETTKGKIRIATSTEASDGTDDLTAMTPAKVKARIDAALVGGVEYKGDYTGQSLVTAKQGDMYISNGDQTLAGVSLTNNDHIIFNQDAADPVTASMFDKIDNTDQVTSVNGQTGPVSLGIGDLNNVTISGGGADGDFVRYDSGDSRWENVTAASINLSDFNNDLSLSGNQITDVASQTGSTFTATANVIYVVGYTTGTQTITFPDASSSTDGDLIGLSSITTTEFTVDLVSSDGTTNDLLNMSNQTKGGTNGAITLTLKQELILFACDGTRWRQLSRELADVAKTGAYADLSGTPTLATVATTGAYSDLSGTPTLGTAAALDVGTGANNVVQLDGSSRLPAVDGSLLTNLPSGGATDLDSLSDVTITTPTSSGQILRNNGSGQFVNVALSIVDDTIPQLGGDLDVNGNAITSASNGNVTINPDGTGDISVGADIIPDADATHTLGSEDNRFITLHSELNGAVQFKARNETGGALTKGQAVYISGVSGDVPLVSLARANSASTMPAHGLLAADVSNNADVQVISFGNLTAYNTTTHSLSLSDTVYVSAATAGALTNTAPTGESNLIQNIGKVVRASATEGIIKVGGAGRSAATPNLDQDKIFLGNASNQAVSTALSSAAVTSFNTQTGALTIGGDDLTADHTASNYTPANANIDGHLSGIDDEFLLKAPLASPSLTGTPTAPTATQGDNSTQLATTAYVDTAVSAGGGGVDPTLTVLSSTSYTLSAANAPGIHIWYAVQNTTALTITLPDVNDVLSNIISAGGSPGDTFEIYIGRRQAGDITISGVENISLLNDSSGAYVSSVTLSNVSNWIKVIGWPSSSTNGKYVISGPSQYQSDALDSISALTTAADKMIYTTASDTYAVTDLTAAGRAILDDADATAQRSTLGLGSAATEDVGTGANNVVQLDGSSRLPAVDGSLLTNLPSGGATDLDGLSDVTITTPTSSGQILRNNGSGQFVNVALSIVDDTSPQLGGDLDVNANEITSASNGNVVIRPNGTGHVFLGGNTNPAEVRLYCESSDAHYVGFKSAAHADYGTSIVWELPTSDGTAGQVLKTDGSGVLSWVDQASGGGGWTYSAITADPANAQAGYHYSCTGSFTITLPTTGVSAGEEVRIKNMGTGTITVDPQTSNIDGSTTDYVMDIQYGAITLVSTGTHWEII